MAFGGLDTDAVRQALRPMLGRGGRLMVARYLDTAFGRSAFTSALGQRVVRGDSVTILTGILRPETVVSVVDAAAYAGASDQTTLWVEPTAPPLDDYEHLTIGGKVWTVQPSSRTHDASGFVLYTLTPGGD